MDSEMKKKLILVILAIIVGLALSLMSPFEGLEQQGMIVLGVFIGVIVLLVFQVLTDSVAFLLMSFLWVVFARLPYSTAFGGFVSPIFFLLLGMFILIAAIYRSGLITRFCIFLLRKMSSTYTGQKVALYISSIILAFAPGIGPELIVSPMILGLSRAMKLPDRSKGTAGLAFMVVAGAAVGYTSFMLGGTANVAVFGTMPPAVQEEIGLAGWFVGALPMVIILGVGMFLVMRKLFDAGSVKVDSSYIEEEWKKLGPMSRDEKVTMVFFVTVILLFIATIWTRWPLAHIAMFGGLGALITGALSLEDFKSSVQWPLILFVGVILSIPAVLAQSGVQDWLGGVLVAPLVGLVDTPFIFVIALFGVALALRFISPSFSVPGIVLVTTLSEPLLAVGISPFVVILVYLVPMYHWVLPHLNPINYMIPYGITEGKAFTHAQGRVAGLCWVVIGFLAVLVSIPYWRLLGLL